MGNNNSTKINQENHSIIQFEPKSSTSPLVESDTNAPTNAPAQDSNVIQRIHFRQESLNSSSGPTFKAKKFDKEKFKMANQKYFLFIDKKE